MHPAQIMFTISVSTMFLVCFVSLVKWKLEIRKERLKRQYERSIQYELDLMCGRKDDN